MENDFPKSKNRTFAIFHFGKTASRFCETVTRAIEHFPQHRKFEKTIFQMSNHDPRFWKIVFQSDARDLVSRMAPSQKPYARRPLVGDTLPTHCPESEPSQPPLPPQMDLNVPTPSADEPNILSSVYFACALASPPITQTKHVYTEAPLRCRALALSSPGTIIAD